MDLESYRIRRITQNKDHYAVQGHGTIRKPICDFLLVINTNLTSYLAPFPRNG